MGLSHTVSGDIASFRTPSRVPIESLKFHFLPKQAAGTPSPEDPIPIEGWTGLNGKHCKKANLCIPSTNYKAGQIIEEKENMTVQYLGNGKYHVFGSSGPSGAQSSEIYIEPFKTEESTNPNRHIKFNNNSSLLNIAFSWNGGADSWSMTTANRESSTYVAMANKEIMGIHFGIQANQVYDAIICPEFYVTEGYEVVPITFPDGETIYGGYVDPVAGEIVAEYIKKVITTFDGNFDVVSGDRFVAYKVIYGTDHTAYLTNPNAMKSNMFIYSDLPRLDAPMYAYGGQSGADVTHHFILPPTITSLADANAWLAELDEPLECTFRLATPIHIPIPAQDLKAFLDHNNFWSDANDITEVTYAVTESKDMLATRKKAMDFNIGHHKKVKWNQFAREASSSYWIPYNTNYAALTFENGVGIRTTLANCNASYIDAIRSVNQPVYHLSHKYYVSQELYSSVSKQYVNVIGSLWRNMQTANANEWTRISYVGSPGTSDDGVGKPLWTCYSAHTYSLEGETCKFRNVMFIDLTLMFGAGNEPTEAEFEHICEINGIDLTTYQPYDEGSDRWLIIP